MPNVGPMEIAIVLIIALVVLGPKKLPELGSSLGKGIREFKGSISGEDREEEQRPAISESTPAPAPVAAVAPAPREHQNV